MPIPAFYDVPDGEWFSEAVQRLADAGVVHGYPADVDHPALWFGGDRNLTRYEMAALVDNLRTAFGV
jgi:S-layer family protein